MLGPMRPACRARDPAARGGRRLGLVILAAGALLAWGARGATPEPGRAELAVVVVGEEAGFLLPAHGGEGLGGRVARAHALGAAGTPTRLLAIGGSVGPGTASSRRLAAEHVRALLTTERAIGHVLAAEDLAEPVLAQGWRGEGPLGEPTPPLNVLLAADHAAFGRAPWLDVEVVGVPLRVLALVGEQAGTPLRDAGLARAWIAPATALQNLLPAPDRCWLVVVDADVDVTALAPALARLSPCVAVVVRGATQAHPPRRDGGVLVAEQVVGARAGLVLTWSRDAEGAWSVAAEALPPAPAPRRRPSTPRSCPPCYARGWTPRRPGGRWQRPGRSVPATSGRTCARPATARWPRTRRSSATRTAAAGWRYPPTPRASPATSRATAPRKRGWPVTPTASRTRTRRRGSTASRARRAMAPVASTCWRRDARARCAATRPRPARAAMRRPRRRASSRAPPALADSTGPWNLIGGRAFLRSGSPASKPPGSGAAEPTSKGTPRRE